MCLKKPKLYLFYDGECSLCVSFNKAVKRMDLRNNIQSMPLQSEKVTDLFPDLDKKYMQQNFTVRTDKGKVFYNEYAIKEVFILLPALKYVSWVYRLPGVNKGMGSMYRNLPFIIGCKEQHGKKKSFPHLRNLQIRGDMITVIGRGHSGTRAISHTLHKSGVFMGSQLNASGDKVPPFKLYDACKIMAKHVNWKGGMEWDFDALHSINIDPQFKDLVNEYLMDVFDDDSEHKGWKLPETTLIYPWIVRMFPDIKYIHWVRDPRDSIIGYHRTDDLHDVGIEYEHIGEPYTPEGAIHEIGHAERRRRAISWKYQYDLMQSTPKPKSWILVRFEDFVLQQEEVLEKLEAFLGFELAKIEVKEESVGRWKTDTKKYRFDFLTDAMEEMGYEI